MQAPLDLTSLPTELELQQWSKTLKEEVHQLASATINEKWKNNPTHASYFCGEPVVVAFTNSAGQIKSQIKKITIDELVANFKVVLACRSTEITDFMWNNSLTLRLYFSGQQTAVLSINGTGVIETHTKEISFEALIANLEATLAGHRTKISSFIWKANPILASYYSGMATTIPVFNSLTEQTELRLKQISFYELIANFKRVLSSQNAGFIKTVWGTNPELASYFSGKSTEMSIAKADGQIEKQTVQMKPDNLLDIFKSALSSRCIEVITSIWDGSSASLLNSVEQMDDVSLSALVQSVLSCDRRINSAFIKEFLSSISNCSVLESILQEESNKSTSTYQANKMQYLQTRIKELKPTQKTLTDPMSHRLFSPQPAQVAVFNRSNTTNQQAMERNIDTLVYRFKSVLRSRCTDSINTIWKVDSELAAYFSGTPFEVSVIDANGQTQLLTRKISAKEWTALFKLVLSSHCTAVIDSMWKGNPEFAGYFSGKPLEVSVGNADRQTEKQTKPICDNDLVANFKSVLASGCSSVIQLMWVNCNSSIKRVVQNMNEESQKELIKCVFSGARSGQSKVIPDFLRLISNLSILESILQETPVGASASRYNIARKKFLEARIEELNPTQKRLCDDSVTNNTMFKKTNSSSSNPNKRYKKDDKTDNCPQGPK